MEIIRFLIALGFSYFLISLFVCTVRMITTVEAELNRKLNNRAKVWALLAFVSLILFAVIHGQITSGEKLL